MKNLYTDGIRNVAMTMVDERMDAAMAATNSNNPWRGESHVEVNLLGV